MKDKTDLRIIKTKKTLFESLIKLMKEKSFEKIKISDICENALINRSTFYAHYEDKYDLLLDLFKQQKISLLKELEEKENKTFSKDYLMELLSILIDHIDKNKEIYSAILSNNRDGFLIDFLIDVIERDTYNILENNIDVIKSNIPLDFIVKFYTGGLINVGVSYITKKEKYTKEDILSYIDRLIPEK